MRNRAEKLGGGLVARTSKLNRAAGAAVEQLETRILFGYYSGDPIDEDPIPQPPCLCGPVASLRADANAGGVGSATTSAPVMNFDGMPNVSAADLSSGGFGTSWGHTRT